MNDLDLVQQIKNGNANAFRFLVSRYQRLVFDVVWRLIEKDQQEVEDISQEVFIKVYKNIKSFRHESKLSTWIASVAWKTGIDYVRKRTRNRIDLKEDVSKFITDFDNSTVSYLNQKEIKNLVLEVINKLPSHYKTALSLFYLEEFSYEEIHEITAMPLGTIKSYLSRAREIFKRIIIEAHGEEFVISMIRDSRLN